MPEEKLIGPAEVARDEDGYWYHPGVPNFDEDVEAYKAWLAAQGLQAAAWHMDSDLEHHPYFEGEAAHCVGWEPKATGAEWFLLGIFDTEEGPCVQWVRRVETQ